VQQAGHAAPAVPALGQRPQRAAQLLWAEGKGAGHHLPGDRVKQAGGVVAQLQGRRGRGQERRRELGAEERGDSWAGLGRVGQGRGENATHRRAGW